MDEQKKNTVQDLLDVDLDAIVADGKKNETPKKKRKTIAIVIGAIILVVLVLMALPHLAGSSEPIVGKWNASVAVESGDIIPITSNSYVNIKKNGTFELHLDGISEETGTWELFDEFDTSEVGTAYVLEFEDGLNGYLFYKDEAINIMIGSIMINFQK